MTGTCQRKCNLSSGKGKKGSEEATPPSPCSYPWLQQALAPPGPGRSAVQGSHRWCWVWVIQAVLARDMGVRLGMPQEVGARHSKNPVETVQPLLLLVLPANLSVCILPLPDVLLVLLRQQAVP